MSPLEALQILDHAAVRADLPRAGHLAVQNAIQLLQAFVTANLSEGAKEGTQKDDKQSGAERQKAQ